MNSSRMCHMFDSKEYSGGNLYVQLAYAMSLWQNAIGQIGIQLFTDNYSTS